MLYSNENDLFENAPFFTPWGWKIITALGVLALTAMLPS